MTTKFVCNRCGKLLPFSNAIIVCTGGMHPDTELMCAKCYKEWSGDGGGG